MGMTITNLCDSCTNIGCEFQSGIVRTKCAFYIAPQIAVKIEPDNCGNYVVMQPTILNAIPKANVYKAIQEIMEYEDYKGFINISSSRLYEILEKYGVSEDGLNEKTSD